jgi:hypothetical protein
MKRTRFGRLAREAHLVGHHDHGHAVVRQLHHDIQHLADHLGVECRGRLVEQDELRLHREGAGDRDALLLAAGELRGHLGSLVGHADSFEKLHRALVGGFLGPDLRTLRGPRVTFSRTVLCANRLNDWKTMPDICPQLCQALALFGRTFPSMVIEPLSMVSRRLIARQSVDLPEPLGPMTTTTSPLPTVVEMFLSTCSSP